VRSFAVQLIGDRWALLQVRRIRLNKSNKPGRANGGNPRDDLVVFTGTRPSGDKSDKYAWRLACAHEKGIAARDEQRRMTVIVTLSDGLAHSATGRLKVKTTYSSVNVPMGNYGLTE